MKFEHFPSFRIYISWSNIKILSYIYKYIRLTLDLIKAFNNKKWRQHKIHLNFHLNTWFIKKIAESWIRPNYYMIFELYINPGIFSNFYLIFKKNIYLKNKIFVVHAFDPDSPLCFKEFSKSCLVCYAIYKDQSRFFIKICFKFTLC